MYTAAQSRELDRRSIEDHGMAGIELMERAGSAVFNAARIEGKSAQRWLVLCGGGNNGGDGYIVARLAIQAGFIVQLIALKPPEQLSGDAALAASRWQEAGGELSDWPLKQSDYFDVVIDALLGTGIDRAPAGPYAEAIDWVNQAGNGISSSSKIIAVDIPSGLYADTGVASEHTIKAARTVTFIGNKRGLYTADGPDHAGEVLFDDLGTPNSIQTDIQPQRADSGNILPEKDISKLLGKRRRNSHKGSFGWVVIVGGNRGMSGAVQLAGLAALRSGAGKVTLATRREHAALVNLACPELMVRGTESEDAMVQLLGQADVLVVGPGLDTTAWSQLALKVAIEMDKPMVLDADALNLLAANEVKAAVTAGAVLTPHPAETARLMDTNTARVQQNRFLAAQQLAERWQAVVVLKGCGSIIAKPNGQWALCAAGNPGMATAGSGDVLSGVIGAMMAQGLDAWGAACAGTQAHARAGDLAARKVGERGMIASDITRYLPNVLND